MGITFSAVKTESANSPALPVYDNLSLAGSDERINPVDEESPDDYQRV